MAARKAPEEQAAPELEGAAPAAPEAPAAEETQPEQPEQPEQPDAADQDDEAPVEHVVVGAAVVLNAADGAARYLYRGARFAATAFEAESLARGIANGLVK